jgi:hypothetical protein
MNQRNQNRIKAIHLELEEKVILVKYAWEEYRDKIQDIQNLLEELEKLFFSSS